jgi:anti-sigma factor RsiW
MKHDEFREMLALRLYGELDERGRAELDAHLRACADCRRFASELDVGLGALRQPRAAADELELPPDWRERLQRAADDGRGRVPISPWWTSAAAFAAGLLAAMLWFHRPSDRALDAPRRDDADGAALIYRHFLGKVEPPPAATNGTLARLGDYRTR